MSEEISVRKIRRIVFLYGSIVEVEVGDEEGWLIFHFSQSGKAQLKGGGGYNENWQVYKRDKKRIEKLQKKAKEAFLNFKLDNLRQRRDLE